MACGKAMVITDCGGNAEIAGPAALKCAPADHPAIAHALQLLLSNLALRKELGQKARARILHDFDVRTTARDLRIAYREVLSGSASRV